MRSAKSMLLLAGVLALAGLQHSPAAAAVATPRGILDGVIRNLLEGLRANLTELVLPDIDLAINVTSLMANLTTTNVTTENLDTYDIAALKTTLLPLRLDELELRWSEFSLAGMYQLIGTLDADALQGPIALTGEGVASLTVRNATLRVEAMTLNSRGGQLSVKDIGYMTASVGETLVELENILQNPDENDEISDVINVFLGFLLTEVVHDDGDNILLALKPTIIEKLDEILADVDFP